MKKVFYLVFAILIFAACKKTDETPIPISGKSFFLDANNGNDNGDGSQSHPFKTFNHVMDSLKNGDTVFLYNGNYGDIVAGRTPGVNFGYSQAEITIPKSSFLTWVTIKAAHGQTPHITKLDIGTLNIPNSGSPAQMIPFSQKGNCDLYMRFEGLIIDDGVMIRGSRYVDIKNCTINRIGDLNGNVNNMDNKAGVNIINGRYITIEGNEITHVSIGVGAATYDLVVKNNHIHHNSHDGIRVEGGENWLIEGNRIHDLDDGVNDNDDTFDPNSNGSWNRHCDGMQVFQLYGPTNGLTVRGNLFYHFESMGVMVGEGPEHYSNWIFENNIFGPVGGAIFILGADIYGSMVFRHNTVVYAPNDTWTSIFGRSMNGQVYSLNLWDVAAVNGGYRFYNNILTKACTIPKAYAFVANNLFCDDESGYPYESVPGNLEDYINQSKLPGSLKSGNIAKDAGVTRYQNELLIDFNGKKRDSKPDIGAIEN